MMGTTIALIFLGALVLGGLLRGFMSAFCASLGLGERMGRRLAAYPVSWVWWTVSGLLVGVLTVWVWVSALAATEAAGTLMSPSMLDVVVLAVLGLLGFVVMAAFSSASQHRREAQR